MDYRAFIIAAFIALAAARPEAPKLSLSLDGGGAESYIVGGSGASDGQWDSVLTLEYRSANGWNHICGAVLYKDKYALTAAHCVYNYAVSNLRLRAGNLDRSIPPTSEEVLPVNSFRIHPQFAPAQPGAPNNMAIITLTIPANTNDPNIGNAILPPADVGDFNHGGCFAVGYGRTDSTGSYSNTLQWLQIPVITNSDCADRMQIVEHAGIIPSHICNLSDPPGKGPCNGDAGGPLYCHPTEQDTSVTYLAGIQSWNVAANGNCNLQYPSVSNRITSFLDWIEENTP